jgi:hypothetical protein
MYTNKHVNATGCLITVSMKFVIFSNQLVTVIFECREVGDTNTWGCYGFICGSFSDAISSLDYIALNGRVDSEMN